MTDGEWSLAWVTASRRWSFCRMWTLTMAVGGLGRCCPPFRLGERPPHEVRPRLSWRQHWTARAPEPSNVE
jgi:hypothetical protein